MVKTHLTGIATLALMALVFGPIASQQSMSFPPTDADGINTVPYARLGDPLEQFGSACNQFIYTDTSLFTTTNTSSPWFNASYAVAEILNLFGNCLFQYVQKTEPFLANIINSTLNNSAQVVTLMQQDLSANITAARALQTAYINGTNRTVLRNITSFVKSSIDSFNSVGSLKFIQQSSVDDFNAYLDSVKNDLNTRSEAAADMNNTMVPLWNNQMNEFNNTLKVVNSTVMATVNKIIFDLANANVSINNSFAINAAASNTTWATGYANFNFPACGLDASAIGASVQSSINGYYGAIQQVLGQFMQTTGTAISTAKAQSEIWRNNVAQYVQSVNDLRNFTMPNRTNLSALTFQNNQTITNLTRQVKTLIGNLSTPFNPFYQPTPVAGQQPAGSAGGQTAQTPSQRWSSFCDNLKNAFNQIYSTFAMGSEEGYMLQNFPASIDEFKNRGNLLIASIGNMATDLNNAFQPAPANRDPNNQMPFDYDNLKSFWNVVLPNVYLTPLNSLIGDIKDQMGKLRQIPLFPASQFMRDPQFNQSLNNFQAFFVNNTMNMTNAFNNARNQWLGFLQSNMNLWRGAANRTAFVGEQIANTTTLFQNYVVQSQNRYLGLKSALERSSFEQTLLTSTKAYHQNFLTYLNGFFPTATVAYPALVATGTYARPYLIMLNDRNMIKVTPGQTLDPSAALSTKIYYYVTIDISSLNRTTVPAIQVSTFQSSNMTAINGSNGATTLNLPVNPQFYNSQPQLPANYTVDPNYTPNWTGLTADPFDSKSDYLVDLISLSASFVVFKITTKSPQFASAGLVLNATVATN